jgi:hypothetical protein
MAFFIDKRYPTGDTAAADICNCKSISSKYAGRNFSYSSNITGTVGDGKSIASAAGNDIRTSALSIYLDG